MLYSWGREIELGQSSAGSRVWSEFHVERLPEGSPPVGQSLDNPTKSAAKEPGIKLSWIKSFSDQVQMPEQEVAKGAKGFSFLLGFVLELSSIVQWTFHQQCAFMFSIQTKVML